MNIHQQIAWLEDQVRWMKKSLPDHLRPLPAQHRLACAESALKTLTHVRGLMNALPRNEGTING